MLKKLLQSISVLLTLALVFSVVTCAPFSVSAAEVDDAADTAADADLAEVSAAPESLFGELSAGRYTLTSQTYADVILSDDYRTKFLEEEGKTEAEYNKLAALVTAMLNYGGAAQVQFADEHPNDDCGLANEGLTAPAALTAAELNAIDTQRPDETLINTVTALYRYHEAAVAYL